MSYFRSKPFSLLLAFAFLCLSFASPQYIQTEVYIQPVEFTFPDFDQSMMRHGLSNAIFKQIYTRKTKNPHLLSMRTNKSDFKDLYDKNRQFYTNDVNAPTKIPKIVHQIWLGSNVPEKFHDWMHSWMKMNGWEYKLWTDKEVKHFPLHNQNLFDNAKDYGEKSDILRYEILFKEGGVYVDIDFECIKPYIFEQLNKSYDFYAGFEPVEHKQPKIASPLVGNAIIGCAAGHPILERLIADMNDHYKKNAKLWAVISTGPVYFTEKIIQFNKTNDPRFINIFLPPTFFFPLTYSEVRYDYENSMKKLIKPESAAIHYWSGSWIDKKKSGDKK